MTNVTKKMKAAQANLARAMELKVLDSARHRNGISGRPFDVFVCEEPTEDGSGVRKMLVVRFAEADKDCAVAVFDLAKLAQGDIAFGSNSWRGDNYHAKLRVLAPEEK